MINSPLLTAKELAEQLKVTQAAVRKWSTQGMPAIRLGSRLVRFQMPVVMDWLQHKAQQPKGAEI